MYKIQFDPATRMVLMCSYIKDGLGNELCDDTIISENPVFERAWISTDGVVMKVGKAPTASHEFDTGSKSWVDTRTLSAVINDALALVDDLAGAARLRYITSVPGQAETYAKKEQQARSWAAESFAGDAPSFIAAEAQALNVSAQSVALEVIELADFWSNIKGPQIEATRRKWKVAIDAAVDPSLIPGLIDSARTELEAL